jgi:hypothetical protein
VEARSQAALVGWQTRRRTMADQLGHVGQQLLEAIQRDLAHRKRLNLRDAGILLGIMLDKAELLAAATGASGPGDLTPEQYMAASPPCWMCWRTGRPTMADRPLEPDDLFSVMDHVVAASQAVLAAYREARATDRIERVISLDLVLRSQSDAILAMAELLESEAPRTRRPGAGDRRVGGGCGWPRRAG